MTSFKDKSWDERYAAGGMGELAEAKFEDVCKRTLRKNFERYGLDRPCLQVGKLPVRIRYQPDYLMSEGFVEVQGFGAKQTMALKVEKYNALQFWHQVHPVAIFVFDSHNDRWTMVGLRRVDGWINSGRTELRYFPEGKAYFQVPASLIFEDA